MYLFFVVEEILQMYNFLYFAIYRKTFDNICIHFYGIILKMKHEYEQHYFFADWYFCLINRYVRYINTKVRNAANPPELSRMIPSRVLGLSHCNTNGSVVEYQHEYDAPSLNITNRKKYFR